MSAEDLEFGDAADEEDLGLPTDTALDEMDLADLGDMEDFTPEDLSDLKLDDEDL